MLTNTPPPLKLGIDILHSELGLESSKGGSSQWFSEDVSS